MDPGNQIRVGTDQLRVKVLFKRVSGKNGECTFPHLKSNKDSTQEDL
jgi:hypothetical protein